MRYRCYQDDRRLRDYGIKDWDKDTFSTFKEAVLHCHRWAYPMPFDPQTPLREMKLGVAVDMGMGETPVMMKVEAISDNLVTATTFQLSHPKKIPLRNGFEVGDEVNSPLGPAILRSLNPETGDCEIELVDAASLFPQIPPESQVRYVIVRLEIRCPDDVSPEEVIKEAEYEFSATQPNCEILDTEISDILEEHP